MGRMDDALTELKRAHELDPVSLITNTEAGWIQYLRRQYDDAIDQYLGTLELDPNFYLVYWGLGLAYEAKFMFDKAISAFEKSRALSQGSGAVVGALGHCLALRGKRAEFATAAQGIEGAIATKVHFPCDAAVIYAGLGDNERAMKWLEAARAEGDPYKSGRWLVHLKVDPRFDGLKIKKKNIPDSMVCARSRGSLTCWRKWACSISLPGKLSSQPKPREVDPSGQGLPLGRDDRPGHCRIPRFPGLVVKLCESPKALLTG